jgi:hypothetical protein
MNTQFIGYEYTITYDDYSMYKDLAQNIDEIKAKCLTLENSDDNYYIEYKEKHKYEDKFLYSETKTLTIENENIPLKHRLVNSFYDKAQMIYDYEDNISNDDIRSCIDDLNKLMEINK